MPFPCIREKGCRVCFFASAALRDAVAGFPRRGRRNYKCAPITTTFSQNGLRESPTLSRYYMSRLSARSGLAACIYPCCYIPAFLPAVALAFAILGTISAPIYRSELYAGTCAQRRDAKDIRQRVCLRGYFS